MRIVIVILVIVTIIIVADYALQKVTAPATACRLVTAYILPDKCAGTCPPGTNCGATATAPYGPDGLLGVQDSACACVPVSPSP